MHDSISIATYIVAANAGGSFCERSGDIVVRKHHNLSFMR